MNDALLTVTGTLTISDLTDLTTGGIATVKVVDSDGEVLAATAFGVDRLPAAFSVDIDSALAPQPRHLQVWAMLRSDEGAWGTVELAGLRDGSAAVELTRIDGSEGEA